MSRLPVLFAGHGGGPLPLLGQQPRVANFLASYPSTLPATPSSILIISPHWVTKGKVKVTSGESHPLMYDYGGFPPETYEYKYPAPGNPELAEEVCQLLNSHDNLKNSSGAIITCEKELTRGWDHGVFVPLLCMYPKARIPVVEMSIEASFDPLLHINIGRALTSLREKGVLIIGSGMSFHNFGYFFARDSATQKRGHKHSHIFNSFLQDTLLSSEVEVPLDKKVQIMSDWASACPSSREAHPIQQEDHLIPLHVAMGAAFGPSCGGGRVVGAGSSGRTIHCRAVGENDYSPEELAFSNFEWVDEESTNKAAVSEGELTVISVDVDGTA